MAKRGTYFEIKQLERRVEKLEKILEKFMEQWGPEVQKKRAGKQDYVSAADHKPVARMLPYA